MVAEHAEWALRKLTGKSALSKSLINEHCVNVFRSYVPEQTAPMDATTCTYTLSFGFADGGPGKRNVHGRTKDIAEGGLGATIPSNIDVGEIVEFELHLPGAMNR